MISLRILYLFLLEYGKNHLVRAFFSLLGISLGVALFVSTTFNGRRAEKALIDFSTGYFGENFDLKIFHNNGALGIEDKLIGKVFYHPEFNWIQKIYPRVKKTLVWKKENETLKVSYQAIDVIKEGIELNLKNNENKEDSNYSFSSVFISTGLKDKGFSKKEILLYKNKEYLFTNVNEIKSEGGLYLIEDIESYKSRNLGSGNYSYLMVKTSEYSNEDLEKLKQFLKKIDSGLDVETKSEILGRADGALKSFHLNLIIISMISVIIAFFMVSNTMTGIYLTRKKELGILRCIGVTPFQNLVLFLSQGLFLGVIGTTLGVYLGILFSKFSFFTGESTVTDWNQTISYTNLPMDIYFWSIFIGISGSVISAITPAIRSYKISPLSIIRNTHDRKKAKNEIILFVFGLFLLVLSFPISRIKLDTNLPFMGLVSIGIIILAQTIQFPFGFKIIVIVLRKFLDLFDKSFVGFRIGIEELFENNLKNTLTGATLMLAVSLVISLSMLTGSYENSIISWTEREFPYPDSIVNEKDIEEGTANGIPLKYYSLLKQEENIEEVDVFYLNTKVEVGSKIFTIHSYNFSLAKKRESENEISTYPEMEEMDILVSSNMAYLNKLKIGDKLEIPTKLGNFHFTIKGTREHFFSENGTIMMDSKVYEKFFQPEEFRALRILYKDDSKREETLVHLNSLISGEKELKIMSSEELKEIYILGTRKVFKVLKSLKYTASIIAFISLFSAILYGLDDKLRIFSMMRTMGGGIIQISGIILSETFFLCFLGTFSGILSSLFLSPIIIDVINKNAFGWSLEIVQPIDLMVYFLLFTFPISVLVSIYPIWILKNLSLREILSYE